jgi:hypothetical protein
MSRWLKRGAPLVARQQGRGHQAVDISLYGMHRRARWRPVVCMEQHSAGLVYRQGRVGRAEQSRGSVGCATIAGSQLVVLSRPGQAWRHWQAQLHRGVAMAESSRLGGRRLQRGRDEARGACGVDVSRVATDLFGEQLLGCLAVGRRSAVWLATAIHSPKRLALFRASRRAAAAATAAALRLPLVCCRNSSIAGGLSSRLLQVVCTHRAPHRTAAARL